MLGVVVAGQFQAAAARSLLPRRLQEARYMESMPPTTARYWAEAVFMLSRVLDVSRNLSHRVPFFKKRK